MSYTDLDTGLGDLRILSSKLDLPGWGWAQHQSFASPVNPYLPTPPETFGAILEVTVVLPIATSCQAAPQCLELWGRAPHQHRGGCPQLDDARSGQLLHASPCPQQCCPTNCQPTGSFPTQDSRLKRSSASPFPPLCLCDCCLSLCF